MVTVLCLVKNNFTFYWCHSESPLLAACRRKQRIFAVAYKKFNELFHFHFQLTLMGKFDKKLQSLYTLKKRLTREGNRLGSRMGVGFMLRSPLPLGSTLFLFFPEFLDYVLRVLFYFVHDKVDCSVAIAKVRLRSSVIFIAILGVFFEMIKLYD